MRLQFLLACFGEGHRGDLDLAILAKAHDIETAVGRGDLVLGADTFSQHLLLELNRSDGEVTRRDALPAQAQQRLDQADRKGRARSHAAARWKISLVVNFESHAVVEIEIAK